MLNRYGDLGFARSEHSLEPEVVVEDSDFFLGEIKDFGHKIGDIGGENALFFIGELELAAKEVATRPAGWAVIENELQNL